LGSVSFVRRHFDAVVVLIIFLSLLPTFREGLKVWMEHRAR
jgi:hypothetical protein